MERYCPTSQGARSPESAKAGLASTQDNVNDWHYGHPAGSHPDSRVSLLESSFSCVLSEKLYVSLLSAQQHFEIVKDFSSAFSLSLFIQAERLLDSIAQGKLEAA